MNEWRTKTCELCVFNQRYNCHFGPPTVVFVATPTGDLIRSYYPPIGDGVPACAKYEEGRGDG